MPNPYFQFKQFKIQQDRCAMKVSTDACLQGAWTPITERVKNVLDIGTGTGLLSLMLAQRNERIQVDAIELDRSAAEQAAENVASSPWRNRVKVIHADVKSYPFKQQFDLLICNPPFFVNSLLGDTDSRNQARHTVALSHFDLLQVLERVLHKDGYASILLPVVEHGDWERLLEGKGWHINHRVNVYPKADRSANRVISLCSRLVTDRPIEETLVIYVAPRQYTVQAAKLLKPFYLKL